MTIRTAAELAAACKNVAENYKTLYVMGCFGAPLTGANVTRYCKNHTYNQAADRTAMIQAVANKTPPYFGFDCVCLIKGLLWGWNGNKSVVYGGAVYKSNGVPDISADSLIGVCKDVSTDFSTIQIGEVVWMRGHVGIYIGDGLAVECSPKWKNCVQITACNTTKTGYNRRNWTMHGKLPYVEYSVEVVETPEKQGEGLKVGDIVNFKGGLHYTSANGSKGQKCAPGRAKITAIYRLGQSKHPYHLVRETGGGSTVYGWVDAADIEGQEEPWKPAAGDIVNFKGNTHYSTANSTKGQKCAPGRAKITAVYRLGQSKHPYHLVKEIGGGSTVHGWVDADTFTKA